MTAIDDLARLPELLSRQDIYDAIKRVSRAIDRFDEALFLSGFHDDAVLDAGAFVCSPRDGYLRGAELHEVGQFATLHHLTNHTCTIHGDEAHAETYFFYVGRNRDETIWQAGGRYADRLDRRDGQWRIAFRCTLMEWSGLMAPTEVPLFVGVADLAVNGLPTRDRSDPTYRRPLVNLRDLQLPADSSQMGRK